MITTTSNLLQLIVVASILTCLPPCRAQSSSTVKSDAIASFQRANDKQQQLYYTNRKVICKVTVNSITDKKISKTTQHTYQFQFDDKYNLVKEEISNTDESIFSLCTVYTSNSLFRVEKVKGKIRLAAFADNRDASKDNPGICSRSSAFPYLTTSLDGNITQEAFLKCKRIEDMNARNINYDSFSQGEYLGKKCMSLSRHGKTTMRTSSSTSESSFKSTHNYDHQNNMVYLGGVYETNGNITYSIPHKVIDRMDYTVDPIRNIPIPKQYTRHVQFGTEPKILESEVEFVSYVDHVPDPEEFRLEKKYGLRTPTTADEPLKPGSSLQSERFEIGHSYWWLYITVSMLLFGLVGLLVYFRRKQQRPA